MRFRDLNTAILGFLLCLPSLGVKGQEQGFLNIVADPGIMIFQDGTLVGLTSESEGGFILTGLLAGTYRFRASLDGYSPLTESIEISAGNISQWTIIKHESSIYTAVHPNKEPQNIVLLSGETISATVIQTTDSAVLYYRHGTNVVESIPRSVVDNIQNDTGVLFSDDLRQLHPDYEYGFLRINFVDIFDDRRAERQVFEMFDKRAEDRDRSYYLYYVITPQLGGDKIIKRIGSGYHNPSASESSNEIYLLPKGFYDIEVYNIYTGRNTVEEEVLELMDRIDTEIEFKVNIEQYNTTTVCLNRAWDYSSLILIESVKSEYRLDPEPSTVYEPAVFEKYRWW